MTDIASPSGQEPALRAIARADGEPPRALVLGATGYIGGRLVPRLLTAGYRVRVLARDATRVSTFEWSERVEVVVGAAADSAALAEAVQDVDVLYYLIHSMSSGKEFEEADRAAARTVAEAAAATRPRGTEAATDAASEATADRGAGGVSRIVYLGGLHPDDADLSPHLRSRVEVGEILLASGVPTLVLQAGVVIGSGSASFEMVRHLTEVLPYMPAPKWVRNRIQPIAVRDVLYYLLAAARVAPDVNRAVDIGGPDVLRYGQMMNGYAVEAGLPQRAIAALPVLTPRLASHWVNLVTPIPRSIARPLVESLQNDCVVKNRDIDAIIPPPEGGLTPYRRAVDLALGRESEDRVETSWLDAEVLGVPSDPLPSDPDWAGRTVFTDARTAHTSADPARLWAVIEGIGGVNGWYSQPLLWAIRGWMDKLVGGVGLARGRRSRSRLEVGDALDFWRVEAIEPGRMLRLRAEMKVPGGAWLELRASPEGDGSRYDQRAVFFPRGLSGRLYWLAVLPFHGFIFRGMANRITATAEGRGS
ncbi:SDR family oxidoreductase [Microbacterium sp. 4R-513]|uniref:SDR family oxidoreductase n=1 Tax=Microbacterium sp. 4R-513 TaxID=2567934 RepID=UPI0013E18B9A|nr:SDR family oxidoreductase [Microbacterium sp. 4R-513]QIG39849.1 SDR family oxidoreductase [Microbacterium sp. 4R-513]